MKFNQRRNEESLTLHSFPRLLNLCRENASEISRFYRARLLNDCSANYCHFSVADCVSISCRIALIRSVSRWLCSPVLENEYIFQGFHKHISFCGVRRFFYKNSKIWSAFVEKKISRKLATFIATRIFPTDVLIIFLLNYLKFPASPGNIAGSKIFSEIKQKELALQCENVMKHSRLCYLPRKLAVFSLICGLS